jgi:hypothetical protein
MNIGLRISGIGRHRSSGGGGPLVAHAAAAVGFPSLGPATTAPVDTTGAGLIVVVGQSDGFANATLTDSKGNMWVLLTANNFPKPNMWSCVAPSVGSGHTFSLITTSDASVTVSLAVAAFGGIVSGAFQTADAPQINTGGSTSFAGIVNPGVGDICVVGIGGANGTGIIGATVDSGFTVTDAIKGPSFWWSSVGLAYLFYTGTPDISAWSSSTAYLAGQIVSRSGNNYRALFNHTNHDPVANDGWWSAPGVEPAGNVCPKVTLAGGAGNGWLPIIASFAA